VVGPVMVLALTTPAPPFAEEGSYYQGSRALTGAHANDDATPQYSVRG